MCNDFTASNIRKIAKEINEANEADRFSTLESWIFKAATQGEFELTVTHPYCTYDVVRYLTAKGFRVDLKNNGTCKISWS